MTPSAAKIVAVLDATVEAELEEWVGALFCTASYRAGVDITPDSMVDNRVVLQSIYRIVGRILADPREPWS